MDARGQNFLHLSVLNQDLEGVIFLLSVKADINSKVQSPTLNTPLHYAVKSGSEIHTRHLVSNDTVYMFMLSPSPERERERERGRVTADGEIATHSI